MSGNVSVLSVDDHGVNKESPSDLSPDETLGHQGVKNTGGNNAYFIVLHCSNMDFSMNILEVHMLFNPFSASPIFGQIQKFFLENLLLARFLFWRDISRDTFF